MRNDLNENEKKKALKKNMKWKKEQKQQKKGTQRRALKIRSVVKNEVDLIFDFNYHFLVGKKGCIFEV